MKRKSCISAVHTWLLLMVVTGRQGLRRQAKHVLKSAQNEHKIESKCGEALNIFLFVSAPQYFFRFYRIYAIIAIKNDFVIH